MKKENKQKNIRNWIIRIFWIFMIGSVFGFFVEMGYALVYTRALEIRKGLIYGPFIQVYGMGAMAFYILVLKIKDPKKLFFSGMLMGGILEYLCSFLQEIFFGNVSWDYSTEFINFNGRTSMMYCFYWGIIAIVFLKVFYPVLQKLDKYIYINWFRIVSVFVILFMAFDITISCMAASRQEERKNSIPAKNQVDIFLDNTYPDELLNKIYHNRYEFK